MSKTCVVCNHSENTSERSITFHAFPKDHKERIRWIDALGVPVSSRDLDFGYICSSHFTIDYFYKHLLKNNSYPNSDFNPTKKCCVNTCTNLHVNSKIRFFTLPFYNKSLLDKWLKAIGINEKFKQAADKKIMICSAHFTDDDFISINGITVLHPTAIPSLFGPLALTTKPSTKDNKILNTNSCQTSSKSIEKDDNCAKVVNCNVHSNEIVLPQNYNPQLPNSSSSMAICDKSGINESDPSTSNIISPEVYKMLESIRTSFDYQYSPTYKLLTAFECNSNNEIDKYMPENSKPLFILVSTKINEETGLPVDVTFVQKVNFKNIYCNDNAGTSPISINLHNQMHPKNDSNHNISQTKPVRKYKQTLEEKLSEEVEHFRKLSRELMSANQKLKTETEDWKKNYMKLKVEFYQLKLKFSEKTGKNI